MNTEKQPAVDENGVQLLDTDKKPIFLGDVLQSMTTGCITRDAFLPKTMIIGKVDPERIESIAYGEVDHKFFTLFPSQYKIDEWEFRLTGESLSSVNEYLMPHAIQTLGEFSFFHHNLRVMRGEETIESFAASLGVEPEDIYNWENYLKPATALDITVLLNYGDFYHRLDHTDGDLLNDFLRIALYESRFR